MDHQNGEEKTRLLIPAAGYGTRVGSPEAKELLFFEGSHLIDFSLALAHRYNLDPLVITRKEKRNLVEYLDQRKIKVQIVEPTCEWPETLLHSNPFWFEKNVVLLPDTRFAPTEVIEQMLNSLATNDVSMACFESLDLTSWGTVVKQGPSLQIWEKPPINAPGSQNRQAWGIFAFKKKVGVSLLNAFLKSNVSKQPISLKLKCELHKLSKFEDLTRGSLLI